MRSRDADRSQTAVEANAGDLLAYFLRRVEVPEDAADLLNDTFLVIWRKVSSLPDDEVAARMWMFGVARRVLSTHRRGSERRSALHEKLRHELGTTTVDERPADQLDVVAAVRLLDPLDQEIIRLIFWDGFTQAQVASLLNMPEATVRSRTHRARQRLRQALSEPCMAQGEAT